MAQVASEERPPDTVVYRGDGTLMGAFRCPRGHSRFGDSGPIQNDIFVFPRTAVRIRHAHGARFLADPTVATVYNQGQIYDRGVVSEEGDRCDWFAVPRAVATEAVVANGLEPSATGPFSFPLAPVRDETYLEQRRLFRRAQIGISKDAIDEEIHSLLDHVVSGAARDLVRHRPDRDVRGAEIADEIRSLLSSRFEEDWPLSRLGKLFSVSTFRLCRSFRKATGSSIHRYLLTVRLRASLERLERPRVDLSGLAFDLGFSSHSHFSLAFTRTFAQTPSACRSSLAQL